MPISGLFFPLDKTQAVWYIEPMTKPAIAPTVEARRRKLMQARTVAIHQRDWQAMNEITKRLAKLPMKTAKGYLYGQP